MTSDDDWTSAGGSSSDTTILEPPRLSQDEGSSSVADGIDVLDHVSPLDGAGLDSVMDMLPLLSSSQSPAKNPLNQ